MMDPKLGINTSTEISKWPAENQTDRRTCHTVTGGVLTPGLQPPGLRKITGRALLYPKSDAYKRIKRQKFI